jgi:hypothetical protein
METDKDIDKDIRVSLRTLGTLAPKSAMLPQPGRGLGIGSPAQGHDQGTTKEYDRGYETLLKDVT